MPILTLWRELLIGGLLLSNLTIFTLWRSAEHEVAMIELASQVAAKDAERVIATQEQITEDTTHAWKAALDVTRADYAKRLRHANVQQMPGISAGAARIADLPADALPLAAGCAETTLMLIQLQGWVKKQGAVQ